MGIAIHNLSASDAEIESLDLTAGVRQSASGLLGTTVQLSDLVSPSPDGSSLIEFDIDNSSFRLFPLWQVVSCTLVQ